MKNIETNEDQYEKLTKSARERIHRLRGKLLTIGANLTGTETYEELRNILRNVCNSPSYISNQKIISKNSLEIKLKKMGIDFPKNSTYDDLNKIYRDEIKNQKETTKKQLELQGSALRNKKDNKIFVVDSQDDDIKYKDALTYAFRSGGFETNRRRH